VNIWTFYTVKLPTEKSGITLAKKLSQLSTLNIHLDSLKLVFTHRKLWSTIGTGRFDFAPFGKAALMENIFFW